MTGRTIAIGDIHGCARALELVLQMISPSSDDVVVPLGDYVDRGPDSKAVIDQIIQLKERCQVAPILGNHEEMMIQVLGGEDPFAGWLRFGGVETLESYGFSGDLEVIPESHRSFLDGLLDYFETDRFVFTHAAYDPWLPMDEQSAEMLRWHSLRDGIPEPHVSGKRFIVGHTANKQGRIIDVDYLTCLDTHCYGGGWLTAMDVEQGLVWQANEAGEQRQLKPGQW